MGLSYPTSLLDEAMPLETFELGRRGNTASNLLQRHGFSAYIGPTAELLTEIQAAATEPDIADNCPSDQTRFTIKNITHWLEKGRIEPFIRTPKRALGAYGWLGFEENKVIPTAPITTAYRVTEAGGTEAREIRRSVDPNFRLGLLLGELVLGVSIFQLGYQPREISLETWKSNHRARSMYGVLGFVQKAEILEKKGRLTVHKEGEYVDGNPVYVDPENPERRRVLDSRCYYVLENY